MPTESPDAPARPRHRWVIELLVVVVVVHSVILTLWLAPASPLRDAAGDNRLASYVDPYFQQGRDVIGVGVGVQKVDESLRVRAVVVADGADEGTVTPWVNLTDLDNKANRHDLTGARVHLIARRLATNLNLAMFNLTAAQRATIATLTALDPPSAVTIKLQESGGGSDGEAIRFFQAYDQMATQFVSLYAQSRWPEGTVEQVQFQVGRRTVPPYADRDKTSVRDQPFRTFSFGPRIAFRGSAEARATFDSYVKK